MQPFTSVEPGVFCGLLAPVPKPLFSFNFQVADYRVIISGCLGNTFLSAVPATLFILKISNSFFFQGIVVMVNSGGVE